MKYILKIFFLFLIKKTPIIAQKKIITDTTSFISVGYNGKPPQFWGDNFKYYIKKTICPFVKGTKIQSVWSFIVEKDGTYTNLKNEYNNGVNNESLKVIECSLNCMPNWIPAQLDGNPIRFRQTVFIITPDGCLFSK